MEFIQDILMQTWETLREMSPFLLFGFLIAGILYVFIKPELVERHLGGKGTSQVVKASVLGVPLPLCSCGVIPVAASLRRHGAGKGATTSFLISTPQTGVDSIMVTLSLLGPVFAVFRPLFAFISGVFGGMVVNTLDRDESGAAPGHPVCTDCDEGGGHRSAGIGGALKYGFHTLPRDINRALIIGIILAGLIGALVPDDFFASVLGGGIVAMLVMMAVGIPIYVCATASVPIAAVLIAKGVSPGAALVFLMTGPATNAATIMTISKVMGRRTAVIYLATVAFSAIAGGMILDAIYQAGSFQGTMEHPWMLPGWLKSISAILVAAVIIGSFFRLPKEKHPEIEDKEGNGMKLKIEGMTCEHCVDSVTRALKECRGVTSARVDLKKGEAVVTGGDIDVSLLREAVEGLGYKVIGTGDSGT
ncbi:MAG: permease [Candidatus Krumholzibacteria bacterium]|nr:permease [Candidatus Krumholzibacteria bacterium]